MRARSTVAVLCLAAAMTPAADGFRRHERTITAHVDRHMPHTIDLLRKSVDIPSGTLNLEGVRRVGALYAAELEPLGFDTRWIEMPPEMRRAGHLVAERRGRRGKRLLLIGHLDTVLEGRPWEQHGQTASGNGTNDMKGGNAVMIAALRALHAAGRLEDRSILVFFTGDEEDVGSPSGVARRDLREAGRRSDVALAFETAVESYATIARRGVSTWRLDVTGKTGHSSGIFGEALGSGAVFEAARILHRFHDELKAPYLTYNAATLVAGTDVTFDDEERAGTAAGKTNVVPRAAVAAGDLRFLSDEQREKAKEKMRAIVAESRPRTSAVIAFADEYPAMPPTEGNRDLLRRLDEVSRDLGLGEVTAYDPGRRGAGDVSFVAADVDALDGLGAHGTGAHAPDETIDLGTLPLLIKRAAVLIDRLGEGSRRESR